MLMSKNQKQPTGFTIVELLIVIVVVGILAAIATVAYNGITTRANRSLIQSTATQLNRQAAAYYAENSTYPSSITDLYNYANFKPDNDKMTMIYSTDSAAYCLSVTVNDQTVRATPGSVVDGAKCGSSGFTGEYFNNISLSGTPLYSDVVAQINYNWGVGSPHASVPVDNFSTRWTGSVVPTVSGDHIFYITSDDGQRLYVNGSLVINNWSAQAPTTRTATVNLTAAEPVDITYEYFEVAGGAVARLEWMPPGGVRAPVRSELD